MFTRLPRWPILLLLAVAVLYCGRHVLGAWMGEYLVQAGPPARADLAVVRGGDPYGNRVLTGGELARQGYVRQVLVSGPAGVYGLHECDLAIPFAIKAGYPAADFIPFPNDAKSTKEEAADVAAELRRRNARSIDLVTSDYHTRRAGRIFRYTAPGIEIHVVSVPDRDFRAGGWWKTRQGEKVFAIEWMKTIAEWLGV
ncbi:MAG: YdcF family protein [Bryobacteraceae bacterium]